MTSNSDFNLSIKCSSELVNQGIVSGMILEVGGSWVESVGSVFFFCILFRSSYGVPQENEGAGPPLKIEQIWNKMGSDPSTL